MLFNFTGAASAVGGLVAGFIVTTVAMPPASPQPAPASMIIDSLTYSQGYVTSTRTIRGFNFNPVKGRFMSASGVMDWVVTIVPQDVDAPSCTTQRGASINEGWSRYTTRKAPSVTLSLDDWVNDPGCYARLDDGVYDHFVTWTPRDGGPPIPFYGEIRINKDADGRDISEATE